MSNPSLSPLAIQTFLIDGQPALGALVYVYAAGTNTPITTYTDSTGETEASNPLVLNARGEPQNVFGASTGIWVPDGVPYKLIFTTPSDTNPPTNPIWTVDNIGVETPRCLTYVIDGGGSVISTGVAGQLYVPFACTLTANTMLADQVGSAVVDIWRVPFADYPGDVSDSITASAPPTITSAQSSQDNTLIGWTVDLNAGDVLMYNVVSASTITRLTVALSAFDS